MEINSVIHTPTITQIKEKLNSPPQLDQSEKQAKYNIQLANVSKEELENKLEAMNRFLESSQTTIRFQLHQELQVYNIEVIDATTEEVIKEIPQKKFLDIYASMAELMGLFVDEKL